MREFLWLDVFRLGWAVASGILVLLGVLFISFGTDVLRFKDAYFSMTPERIAYRLALLSPEKQISWKEIKELKISELLISFVLVSGKTVTMRLGSIQQPHIARHVSRSIHLAAFEKGIVVNGVKPTPDDPVLQI